ncbi:uncharacterized protein LOC124699982 [Lolium rigidum]|uniref:uncharacterized protein LOC124699982 n=1 Tax=Lolium rigidum TaxID=89674 RepID=UPI001F5C3306|nr:uncharacterized protein LOC124699982 [Lolium rigidum]
MFGNKSRIIMWIGGKMASLSSIVPSQSSTSRGLPQQGHHQLPLPRQESQTWLGRIAESRRGCCNCRHPFPAAFDGLCAHPLLRRSPTPSLPDPAWETWGSRQSGVCELRIRDPWLRRHGDP